MTNLVADLLILFGLVVLMCYSGSALNRDGLSHFQGGVVPLINVHGLASTFGKCVLCFEGLALTLPLQEAVKPRSQRQFLRLFVCTIGCVTVFWVIFATLNWFAIGNSVHTVLMLSLPSDKWIAAVQAAYCLAVVFTFPLQLFPATTILNKGAVFLGCFKKRSAQEMAHLRCCSWPENSLRIGVVACLAVMAVAAADSMSQAVSLVGSLCFVPLAFIYPPLLHMRLVARTLPSKAADAALAVLGVGLMAFTSAETLLHWGNDGESESGSSGSASDK